MYSTVNLTEQNPLKIFILQTSTKTRMSRENKGDKEKGNNRKGNAEN
jgi:hypothetical protein